VINNVEISQQSNTVDCVIGGSATTAFQITNKSGRVQRLGSRIIAVDPLPEAAMMILGRPQRRVADQQTEDIEITISLPGDLQPGNYEFSLLVFDPEEPGEKYVESDRIKISATVAHKSVGEKRKLPWKLIAATTLLLMGGVIAAFVFSGKDDTGGSTTEVTGKNLKYFSIGQHHYELKKNNIWHEMKGDQITNTFAEQRRDDSSVYMRDESRKMDLQADLHRKMVVLKVDGQEPFDYKNIVDWRN